jgi:hypothetical protein
MSQETGAAFPPPAATPKKNKPWIIAIVVIVVVCCGCFGVAGLLFGFWEPIMQALGLNALLPVQMVPL